MKAKTCGLPMKLFIPFGILEFWLPLIYCLMTDTFKILFTTIPLSFLIISYGINHENDIIPISKPKSIHFNRKTNIKIDHDLEEAFKELDEYLAKNKQWETPLRP